MLNKYLVVIVISLIAINWNAQLRWYGSAPDRIAGLGYQVEVHKVTTADGYILELHRIPFSPNNKHKDQRRPVVLLVHGLFSSSDCFLLNGIENSLGFQASNEGYDVWLINLRGNRYSSHHVNLSTLSMEFWSFTFHEMAIYDLPSTIDYILKVTDQQNIHYIGHSQASNIYMALLSEKPEYNSVLKTGHLLSAGINKDDTVLDRVYIGRSMLPVLNFLNYGSFGLHLYFTPLNYFLWLISQTPIVKTVFSNLIGVFSGTSTTLNMVTIKFNFFRKYSKSLYFTDSFA